MAGAYVKFSNVGDGLGGGFENNNELKPMKYNEAIHGPDGEAWKQEIKNEHNRMVKNQVFGKLKKMTCLKAQRSFTAPERARRRALEHYKGD